MLRKISFLLSGLLLPVALLAAPDAFTFAQREGVATNVFITSSTATVSGADGPWQVQVSGGNGAQLSIDGGPFTNAATTIGAGTTLRVRHVSADQPDTATVSTVTVGTTNATFTTVTGAIDRTPDSFSFGNQGNVEPSTFVTSPAVTLTGFNTALPVQAGPGIQYRIGNGEFTSSNGALQPGQTLVVGHTSSERRLDYKKSYLKVGGVIGYFTTRTQGPVAPVAVDDRYTGAQATLLSVAAPGVLGNDTHDGALTAAVASSTSNGILNLAANGSFTYDPAAGFSGTDSFTYRSSAGGSSSGPATVTITVVANRPPVAEPASFTMDEDTVLNGQLFATDADGHALTYAKASDPAHGVVVVGSGGSFTYTPAADYFGADSFTFVANDGRVDSAPALVSITIIDTPDTITFNRYEFANRCFAIKSVASDKFLAKTGAGTQATYAASAATLAAAEKFYMKPSALGEYLLYGKDRQLLAAQAAPGNPTGPLCIPGPLCSQLLNDPQGTNEVTDAAIIVVKVANDATVYPPPPQFDVAPTPALINTYRGFAEQNPRDSVFNLASRPDGRRLSAVPAGTLSLATAAATSAQQFSFEELDSADCANFPEAESNASGEPFKGATPDGRVLGMADVHVHTLSTTFLGNAKAGAPFHKFGVTHALGDCESMHGEQGRRDFLTAAWQQDFSGHDTAGWPDFTDWPAKDSLTHESIYWKWIERAWLGGLRVMVNDLVENATLCELQRNNSGVPGDCNEMNSARKQVGSMYAMQDYIDAQYGGRGKGWFRIVLTPEEARRVIEDGKLAVVIGVEISNLFNCQMTYSPARVKEPWEEMGANPLTEGSPNENAYKCAMTETGAPNEIKTQIDEFVALGVRQIITIHEFDNAFGGNGIFDGLFLNLGNRENSGGNPTPGVPGTPDGSADPFAGNPPAVPDGETPSGEFWTTYDCPTEAALAAATPNDGYLWGSSGGSVMNNSGSLPAQYPTGQPFPLGCVYTGQGGRHGGANACYPARVPQCNARILTPIGLYTYKKLMEAGLLFDWDHLTLEMKNQVLELAEAQDPPYPIISTHGTFGGTTLEQTRRALVAGGFMYPSLGSSSGLRGDMAEVLTEWGRANWPAGQGRFLFGFGFGTDTNGLSGQAGNEPGVNYPYTLFTGSGFNALADFSNAPPVTFGQPESHDLNGNLAKSWDIKSVGSAHYGMLSEMVEGMRKNGTPTQLQYLFNSAEVYLQTWERSSAPRAAIAVPDGILRPAPGANPPPIPSSEPPLLGPLGFTEEPVAPRSRPLPRDRGAAQPQTFR